MRALIVEDNELFRIAVREIVATAAHFTEIIEANSELELLKFISSCPSLTLVVISGRCLPDGREVYIKLMQRLHSNLAVMVMTNEGDKIKEQLQGVIIAPKNSPASELIATIRMAIKLKAKARAQSGSNTASNEKPRDCNGSLTSRQRQIISLAAQGLRNKDIAVALDLAEGTVKAHMNSILRKLNARNRTQAVLNFRNG